MLPKKLLPPTEARIDSRELVIGEDVLALQQVGVLRTTIDEATCTYQVK